MFAPNKAEPPSELRILPDRVISGENAGEPSGLSKAPISGLEPSGSGLILFSIS